MDLASNLALTDKLLERITGIAWSSGEPCPPQWSQPLQGWDPITLVKKTLELSESSDQIMEALRTTKLDPKIILAIALLNRITATQFSPRDAIPAIWHQKMLLKTPMEMVAHTIGMEPALLSGSIKKIAKSELKPRSGVVWPIRHCVYYKLLRLLRRRLAETDWTELSGRWVTGQLLYPVEISTAELRSLINTAAEECRVTFDPNLRGDQDERIPFIERLQQEGYLVKSDMGGRRGPHVVYLRRGYTGRAILVKNKWLRTITGAEKDRLPELRKRTDILLTDRTRRRTIAPPPEIIEVDESELEREIAAEQEAKEQADAKELAEIWIKEFVKQTRPPSPEKTLSFEEWVEDAGFTHIEDKIRNEVLAISQKQRRRRRNPGDPFQNPFQLTPKNRKWYSYFWESILAEDLAVKIIAEMLEDGSYLIPNQYLEDYSWADLSDLLTEIGLIFTVSPKEICLTLIRLKLLNPNTLCEFGDEISPVLPTQKKIIYPVERMATPKLDKDRVVVTAGGFESDVPRWIRETFEINHYAEPPCNMPTKPDIILFKTAKFSHSGTQPPEEAARFNLHAKIARSRSYKRGMPLTPELIELFRDVPYVPGYGYALVMQTVRGMLPEWDIGWFLDAHKKWLAAQKEKRVRED